jgi:uncharacterized Zn finger protein
VLDAVSGDMLLLGQLLGGTLPIELLDALEAKGVQLLPSAYAQLG